jgi:hypothetical protein
MKTAKEFAEERQYDLEEHDEGGYLGINENAFAKLLDEYADQKVNELNKAEDELIIAGLEEGSENWKAEYDNCRAILSELVAVKKINDEQGKTIEYLSRQPEAWKAAKEFLINYQHQSW